MEMVGQLCMEINRLRNGLQIAIERSPMLALGLALVVAFEG
jgi:hypothetical protein